MQTSTSVLRQSKSETEYLSFIISQALESGYAVAVWRLPNDDTKHLIVSKQHDQLPAETPLEDLHPGFLFAPFNKAADRTYLKADLAFSFSKGKLEAPKNPIQANSDIWLQTKLAEPVKHAPIRYHLKQEPMCMEKQGFTDMVAAGIRKIQDGHFEKIVPSRAALHPITPSFDMVQAFLNLSDANPNAFVSLVSAPETGTWLGATPELLVSVENKNLFRTIALAATQPFRPGVNLKSVAWTQKDIEEHALVERYIVNSFKKIRLREFEEHGPKTVVAGNLLHLKSEFSVDMEATNFPQLGSVMLQLLHPTSAVCGVPLEPAQDFLRKYEGYDRQYYSGYLGPVNFNNSIAIFVNLRCAQLLADRAILYAGAGVTIDSIPEDEWNETQIKMNTLLQVISQQLAR